jgi:hypothetical protein
MTLSNFLTTTESRITNNIVNRLVPMESLQEVRRPSLSGLTTCARGGIVDIILSDFGFRMPILVAVEEPIMHTNAVAYKSRLQ